MTTIQEYLNNEYPTQKEKNKEESIGSSSLYGKKLEGGKLIIDNWPNLSCIALEGSWLMTKLTELEVNNCPKLETVRGCNNDLTSLVISDCPIVKRVFFDYNKLKKIEINNCPLIREISFGRNQLNDLKLLGSFLNSEKITSLRLWDNKFLSRDLSFFSKFINLEELWISDNLFTGSLKFLEGMKNLKRLHIDNTDIDSGLEYLPKSIEELLCSADNSTEKKWAIKKIQTLLKGYEGWRGEHNYQAWRKAELISQKFAQEELLDFIYLAGLTDLRGSKNTNHQLIRKTFECVVFYLEEEIRKCEKELYKDKEEKAQIEIPPK